MTQTRRNFLKATAAFCVAPLGFSLKKPLPDSFVLGRTGRIDLKIFQSAMGCINAKPYRSYPAKTLMLEGFLYCPILTIRGKWRLVSRFMRAKQYQASFQNGVEVYRSVDFNLIDFGEEMPA